MVVFDPLAPVFALDEVVDHAAFQRPGAIERARGDDVLEAVRAQLLEQLAEPGRFQLEDAGDVGLRDHLVDLDVVERDERQVELPLAARGALAVDVIEADLDHRQRLEAEEVELHQPGLLDHVLVVLGDDARVFARRPEAGDVLPQRAIADDDAGGVLAGVAVQAFQLLRVIEQVR